LCAALAQVPALALVYTHTGPFAWDGLMSWWIPLSDFFIWIVAMMALSIRAASAQDEPELPKPFASANPQERQTTA
jgi:hypothetical protein